MSSAYIERQKMISRVAGLTIKTVGIGTIFCILGIVLVIAMEVVPLFKSPTLRQVAELKLQPLLGEVVGAGKDEYFENIFAIGRSGDLAFISLVDNREARTIKLERGDASSFILGADVHMSGCATLLWDSGEVTVYHIRFKPKYGNEGRRTIEGSVEKIFSCGVGEVGFKAKSVYGRVIEDGILLVARAEDGRGVVVRQTRTEDFLGHVSESLNSHPLEMAAGDNDYTVELNHSGTFLYAGTSHGKVVEWDLRGEQPKIQESFSVPDGTSRVTAMASLLGDNALAVADASSRIQVYSKVPSADGGARTTQMIHKLPSVKNGSVLTMVASPRNRTLLVQYDTGHVQAIYTTSEHILAELAYPGPQSILAFSKRGKGWIAVDTSGTARVTSFESEHPESSWKTFLGSIWYESYPEPDYTWQSSSGGDEFEPKLSLIPLVFGSLKGAFYAMIFAVPLSLLAAVYTSQFAGNALRQTVKPIVEVMAAIPSVVIGFLAALWLAPIMNDRLMYVLALVMFAPFFACSLMFVPFHRLKQTHNGKAKEGRELLFLLPILALFALITLPLADIVEKFFFEGDIKHWIVSNFSGGYEMRNCLIIGFALGFTVIPILFTMAEDALTSVPRSLSTASLALGATPWQTAWNVVLPAASPGIFAGIILGFGRAVGETMIVLMATGNTPILDISPFNGMRTLSANIAVEIPEAPVGGTLYRVLFLSAAVLLIFTSISNSITELIRSRLRKTYSKF